MPDIASDTGPYIYLYRKMSAGYYYGLNYIEPTIGSHSAINGFKQYFNFNVGRASSENAANLCIVPVPFSAPVSPVRSMSVV